MTAHILNPALDADYPATLSEKTIEGILRKELRFQKVVFSDDMEMKAITDHYGAEEAAILAVLAGCDILIYRGDAGIPLSCIEAVIQAVESGRIPLEKVERANQRILSTKKVYCDSQKPLDVTEVGKNIGLPEHFQLADIITKKELPKNLPPEVDY